MSRNSYRYKFVDTPLTRSAYTWSSNRLGSLSVQSESLAEIVRNHFMNSKAPEEFTNYDSKIIGQEIAFELEF